MEEEAKQEKEYAKKLQEDVRKMLENATMLDQTAQSVTRQFLLFVETLYFYLAVTYRYFDRKYVLKLLKRS